MARRLKPPIFVLGSGRSGTTMMLHCLGSHPDVVPWHEPRPVWVYADPGRTHDVFEEADASEKVIRYVRKRFLDYQEKHGSRRIAEKTPSNVLRIPYVHRIFPEARFVYLIRNPLAQFASAREAWHRPVGWTRVWRRIAITPRSQLHHYAGAFARDFVAMALRRRRRRSTFGERYPGMQEDLERLPHEVVVGKQWDYCSRRAEADLARLDPALVLRLRYEDLVAEPVPRFRDVFAHFGLDVPTHVERFVESRIDPTRGAKWKDLDPEVLRRCIPVFREEMARHGYPVPEDLLEAPGGT